MSVLLETSVGDIVIDLHTKLCPDACKNFLKLCKVKFYDGVLFHNVQKDYIIQTGDPTGTGRGGESIFGLMYGEQARYFEDEFHPSLHHKAAGVVSMANAGLPNTNGSQFLITVGTDLDALDDHNTIFGYVAEGMDTVMKINQVFVDKEGAPFQIIRLRYVYILDDPFPDPVGLPIPDRSPVREVPEQFKNRLEEGEEVEMPDDQAKDNAERLQREMEARSRAEVLEMIGDLPVADVKPPDNVIFVCKLNPITESPDLELIFSRFGTILSCEVIRDRKTDDSLCYAFIEFEEESQAEQAYLKMDNVLIDDRRIHVDFSQSVSKLRQDYGIYDTGFFGERYRKYVESLQIGAEREDEVDQMQEKKFAGRRVRESGIPSRGGARGRGGRGGRGRGRGDVTPGGYGARGNFGGRGRGNFGGGRQEYERHDNNEQRGRSDQRESRYDDRSSDRDDDRSKRRRTDESSSRDRDDSRRDDKRRDDRGRDSSRSERDRHHDRSRRDDKDSKRR